MSLIILYSSMIFFWNDSDDFWCRKVLWKPKNFKSSNDLKKTYWAKKVLPYRRHYNPLLIWNHSWILTVHKVRILRKMFLKKTFLAFKNGVKSVPTAGYNGVRKVYQQGEILQYCNSTVEVQYSWVIFN